MPEGFSATTSVSITSHAKRRVNNETDSAQDQGEGMTDSSSEPPDEDEKPVIHAVVVHGDPSMPNSILPGGKWDEDDFDAIEYLKRTLNKIEGYTFTFLCKHDTLFEDLKKLKEHGMVDVVLQFCDEGWKNHHRMELHICAMLEMLSIPYTGSGPACIGVSLDKHTMLLIAESIGIPVPKTVYIEDETAADVNWGAFKYPLLVKSNSTDGSYGLTKKNVCQNEEELREAIKQIRELFGIPGPLLIQEYLEGADVNCAILGNVPGPHLVFPITEEDYSALPADWPKICGFENKWDPESPYWKIRSVPTTLDAQKQQFIIEKSRSLFRRCGIRDYARFDWRLDSKGNPYLLEVNPNCAWCEDGHMAKTAYLAGISYVKMLQMIIEAAILRSKTQPNCHDLKYVDLELVRKSAKD